MLSDRYLHVAAWNFSSSVRQLLVPLTAGASVVVASDMERQDPAELIGLMRREGVTVLDTTPSLLRNLAFAVASGLVPGPAGLSLRLVICASEVLNVGDVERFCKAFRFSGDFRYYYGLTETAGPTATASRPGGSWPSGTFESAMTALPECDIRILDEQLNEVPDGVAGEIAVLVAPGDVYYEGNRGPRRCLRFRARGARMAG